MPQACNVLRLDEEVGQFKLAAHIGRIENTVRSKAHRPNGIALGVISFACPGHGSERRAAPDSIKNPRLVLARVVPDADAPDEPARGRDVPARRITIKPTGRAISDLRPARRIEH